MKLIALFCSLLLVASVAANSTYAALVSEYQPNPSGADASLQTGELSGMAGTIFS